MHSLKHHLWRPAFVAAGVTLMVGGPLHPESDAKDPLRQELATMTSGDTWVLSHSLLALGTALLAVGLWKAHRDRAWPSSTHRALRAGAFAMSVYVVETLVHLAAAIDSGPLGNGEAAPVAFTHLGLAVVLYPVSGLAVTWVSAKLLAAAPLPGKVFAVAGLVGGLLHAISVPLTILFPDVELSPMFAGAGMLFAVWAIGTGLTPVRRVSTDASPRRRPAVLSSVGPRSN